MPKGTLDLNKYKNVLPTVKTMVILPFLEGCCARVAAAPTPRRGLERRERVRERQQGARRGRQDQVHWWVCGCVAQRLMRRSGAGPNRQAGRARVACRVGVPLPRRCHGDRCGCSCMLCAIIHAPSQPSLNLGRRLGGGRQEEVRTVPAHQGLPRAQAERHQGNTVLQCAGAHACRSSSWRPSRTSTLRSCACASSGRTTISLAPTSASLAGRTAVRD